MSLFLSGLVIGGSLGVLIVALISATVAPAPAPGQKSWVRNGEDVEL